MLDHLKLWLNFASLYTAVFIFFWNNAIKYIAMQNNSVDSSYKEITQ